MTHYRSNVRDLVFDLFELFERSSVYGLAPFAGMDQDTACAILAEADRYASRTLAPSFSDVDRVGLVFDPESWSVRLPKEFREAAVDYLQSGWLDIEYPPRDGEESAPPSLRWCVTELMLGANPPVPMGLNVMPQAVRLLLSHGTPDQQRLADLIRAERWMVTMVLTEPDAGSDVGAVRTRAARQADGSWHLTGVKRFITYGDHDLTDNIVHLVLARPTGVDGVGGPGTRGLSLFVVPKYHVDLTTGECLGRNGVHVTGLERKMGIKVNPTCELTFGESAPAVGWLLGDSHAGIGQMFEILKHFRMLVGVKSMATLSTGYLTARDYAVNRIQGAPLVKTAEVAGIPIADHPDVRRSLLTQKAYAEGLRALVLFAAVQQDQLEVARAAGAPDAEADARHQLLLPVIKGYCSETAWRVLGQECLQTLGGSGYLQDYPVEQYVRDTKVDSLYEGTTAIQALDLLGRKIVRDRGAALNALLAEVETTAESTAGSRLDSADGPLLARALTDFSAMTEILVQRWTSDRAVAALDCTRLLLRLGDLLCGWLLIRSATVATRAVNTAAGADRDFYLGKIAAGSWFARTVLPTIAADLASVQMTTAEINGLPHSAL